MLIDGKLISNQIKTELSKEVEQLKEKSLITEAILAKKIRENAKIQGKNKAGLCLKDLELCLEHLSQNNQLNFALHLNSANDILIKKDYNINNIEEKVRQNHNEIDDRIRYSRLGKVSRRASCRL